MSDRNTKRFVKDFNHRSRKKFDRKKKEERKPQKARDAGARAKRMLQRREYAAKISGSEDNVPDYMREAKMTEKQKRKDTMLKKKYDKSDMKKSMQKR